jgi:hypothetical protein
MCKKDVAARSQAIMRELADSERLPDEIRKGKIVKEICKNRHVNNLFYSLPAYILA